MLVPCMVKSSLNRWAPTSWPSGRASWSRITSASSPAIRKKTKALAP